MAYTAHFATEAEARTYMGSFDAPLAAEAATDIDPATTSAAHDTKRPAAPTGRPPRRRRTVR